MNCYFLGITGLALLGGSISTLTINEEQHNILRNAFPDNLDKKYEAIIIERRNHYLIGLLIGLVLAFIVVRNVRLANYFTRLALSLTITLGTAVIFYTFMPKTDYMRRHLKTPAEHKKWVEVCRFMKSRYLTGAILGALAAIPIASIMC
jgi:glucan phosphoethanolaminetransferase (alkaline phosphatase superfamily)